jgi:hypothetical protein
MWNINRGAFIHMLPEALENIGQAYKKYFVTQLLGSSPSLLWKSFSIDATATKKSETAFTTTLME